MNIPRSVRTSRVFPVLILDHKFPPKRRLIARWVLVVLAFILALGMSLAHLTAWSLAGVYPFVVGGVLASGSLATSLFFLELFRLSQYRLSHKQPEAFHYEVLDMLYTTDRENIMQAYVYSALGEALFSRLEIPTQEREAFFSEYHGAHIGMSELLDAEVRSSADLVAYLIHTDDTFAAFFTQQGLNRDEVIQAAQLELVRIQEKIQLRYTQKPHRSIYVTWLLPEVLPEPVRQFAREIKQAPVSLRMAPHTHTVRELAHALEQAASWTILASPTRHTAEPFVDELVQYLAVHGATDQLADKRIYRIDLSGLIRRARTKDDIHAHLDLVSEVARTHIVVLDHVSLAEAQAQEHDVDLLGHLAQVTGPIYGIAIRTATSTAPDVSGMSYVSVHDETAMPLYAYTYARAIERAQHITISYRALFAAVAYAQAQDGQPYGKLVALLLDTAVSAGLARGRTTITRSDVSDTTGMRERVPAHATRTTADILLHIEELLLTYVAGQEMAIRVLSNILRRVYGRDTRADKPQATLLFAGPHAVGKKTTARTLAHILFGDANKVFVVSGADLQTPADEKRLIGSYENTSTGLLPRILRKQTSGILVLEAPEQAHPTVRAHLYDLISSGALTDGYGQTVSAAHMLIVVVCEVQTQPYETYEAGRMQVTALSDDGKLPQPVVAAVDRSVVFEPLTRTAITEIARRIIGQYQKRFSLHGSTLSVSDGAYQALTELAERHPDGVAYMVRCMARLCDMHQARQARSVSISRMDVVRISGQGLGR